MLRLVDRISIFVGKVGGIISYLQDANAAVVEKVLAALTDSECSAAVEALDVETCDVLMKYLYRFMWRASNCQTSLKLHALLTEKAGHGCIVRALTDRKTV
jgi:actin related protein 2/3 complex subunit 5